MTKKPRPYEVPLLGDPEIKTAMQRWYERQHVYPAEGRRQLSEATGVPVRTLERAEQTGAFPYPRLLLIALEVL